MSCAISFSRSARRDRPAPAVRLAVAVHEEALVVRVLGLLHPLLELLRRVVQVVRVDVAGVEVQLVDELRAERRPVLLEVIAQVVVLLPVLRDLAIDLAGSLVEQRLEIAVLADRPEHRGPDVDLLARSALGAVRQLEVIALLGGHDQLAVRRAGCSRSAPCASRPSCRTRSRPRRC